MHLDRRLPARLVERLAAPAERWATGRIPWFSGARAPDFLGIGAAKAGTTWLYENLLHHPGIFIPRKEINYLYLYYWRSPRWYLRHFKEAGPLRAGDITPQYALINSSRIRWVHRLNPGLRLVFLIRNPIERAWSYARMHVAQLPGRDAASVTADEWIASIRGKQSIARGRYLDTIDRWSAVFGEPALLTLLYDDIAARPHDLLRDVFEHIGVDASLDLSGFPTAETIRKGVGFPMPDEVREELERLYRSQIRGVQARFGEATLGW